MTEKQININYLKEKYLSPTWESMLEEAQDWYREGLKQGKFDKEAEKQQLISFLEDKIRKNKNVKEMDIDSLNDKFADEKTEKKIKQILENGIKECDIEMKTYKEVLNFIKKGDKDE